MVQGGWSYGSFLVSRVTLLFGLFNNISGRAWGGTGKGWTGGAAQPHDSEIFILVWHFHSFLQGNQNNSSETRFAQISAYMFKMHSDWPVVLPGWKRSLSSHFIEEGNTCWAVVTDDLWPRRSISVFYLLLKTAAQRGGGVDISAKVLITLAMLKKSYTTYFLL